jgi:hypothetical protein
MGTQIKGKMGRRYSKNAKKCIIMDTEFLYGSEVERGQRDHLGDLDIGGRLMLK